MKLLSRRALDQLGTLQANVQELAAHWNTALRMFVASRTPPPPWHSGSSGSSSPGSTRSIGSPHAASRNSVASTARAPGPAGASTLPETLVTTLACAPGAQSLHNIRILASESPDTWS
jgi:hypothetical protein